MTTTATYQGMENVEKPTSRVLAPPGGASNFSIGGYGGDEPAVTPAKMQGVVDTKNNLFGQTEGTPQGTKPGSNRRNVSTLYMGGDVATPVDDSKPTRRQYNYHESNSFSAVYGRPGEDPKPEITHESRKKPGKQEDGISPITGQIAGSSVSSTTQSDAPRSRKPERLRPEELPAAGVKAYAPEPQGKRSIPPGGPSSGIF